jgi:alpha-beta hydrolase superfamily lysophospholipase
VSDGRAVAETTGTVRSDDGTAIFYRAWTATGATTADAVIVVPGIGLHSAPYHVVAEALVPAGHHVVGIDLRGHGHSGGVRGTVPGPRAIVADIDAVAGWVRATHGVARVHLLGESMGGLVALNYAAARVERLASLVLVAPAIRVACTQVARLSNLVLAPGLFTPQRPVLDLAGARLDEATVDEAFKRARRADPLAHNVVGIRYLPGLARLRARWRDKARRVTVPTLIFHGRRDAILDWRGSRALHAAIGAAVRELVLLDDARHTLFWDPASADVFTRLRDWLAAGAR